MTVTVKTRQVVVKGPRGELKNDLSHLPVDLQIKDDGKKVIVERWFTSGKQAASIRTACTHINNMIIGVTKGFQYKMRFVYSHFPINVAITNKDARVEIRNFLGEKVRRRPRPAPPPLPFHLHQATGAERAALQEHHAAGKSCSG